jgi:hypothetical protein
MLAFGMNKKFNHVDSFGFNICWNFKIKNENPP